MEPAEHAPRLATLADAEQIAQLLDAFNREFHVATPGVDLLAPRLRALLSGDDTLAIMVGHPGDAVGLITLRPNVWSAGPVALLDELYVVPRLRGQGIGSAIIEHLLLLARTLAVGWIEINVDEGDVDARRFYERHGFSATEPGTGERALYYVREPVG